MIRNNIVNYIYRNIQNKCKEFGTLLIAILMSFDDPFDLTPDSFPQTRKDYWDQSSSESLNDFVQFERFSSFDGMFLLLLFVYYYHYYYCYYYCSIIA